MHRRVTPLMPNLSQFEHEEETEQDREEWTKFQYVEQYIDKMIVDCSEATLLARSGDPLNTSVDEI